MQFNITVNQFAAITSGFELDIIDIAIFDFIQQFVASGNIEIVNTEQGEFFWVKNEKIIEELPLLRIKTKRGVRNRVNNLVDAGLLERCEDKAYSNYSLYRPGHRWGELSHVNFKKAVENVRVRQQSVEQNAQNLIGGNNGTSRGGKIDSPLYHNTNISNINISNNACAREASGGKQSETQKLAADVKDLLDAERHQIWREQFCMLRDITPETLDTAIMRAYEKVICKGYTNGNPKSLVYNEVKGMPKGTLDERKAAFGKEIEPHVERFGRSMCIEFFHPEWRIATKDPVTIL